MVAGFLVESERTCGVFGPRCNPLFLHFVPKIQLFTEIIGNPAVFQRSNLHFKVNVRIGRIDSGGSQILAFKVNNCNLFGLVPVYVG